MHTVWERGGRAKSSRHCSGKWARMARHRLGISGQQQSSRVKAGPWETIKYGAYEVRILDPYHHCKQSEDAVYRPGERIDDMSGPVGVVDAIGSDL